MERRLKYQLFGGTQLLLQVCFSFEGGHRRRTTHLVAIFQGMNAASLLVDRSSGRCRGRLWFALCIWVEPKRGMDWKESMLADLLPSGVSTISIWSVVCLDITCRESVPDMRARARRERERERVEQARANDSRIHSPK